MNGDAILVRLLDDDDDLRKAVFPHREVTLGRLARCEPRWTRLEPRPPTR